MAILPYHYHDEEEYTIDDLEAGDYIPMSLWGKDHWSTLAYLETRIVDGKGLIDNTRMRCDARLHRAFAWSGPFSGIVQDGAKYPTRTKTGDVPNHDDWSCLEDMIASGLLRAWFTVVRHGEPIGGSQARVEFADLGLQVANELRNHKARVGNFHTFQPSLVMATA